MDDAATNLDSDVFAKAATTIKACMEATHQLGGQNCVLWRGREGHETRPNTDLARERHQAGGCFEWLSSTSARLRLRVGSSSDPNHRNRPSINATTYVAPIHAFLLKFNFEAESKVSAEQERAILARHSFKHELATVAAFGIFGSIDMNRNDYLPVWHADHFPNDSSEVALAYFEILGASSYTTEGTNFDAKLQRRSLDPEDLASRPVSGRQAYLENVVNRVA